MRYTVLDVKTTHVVVEFEDATVARVPLSADMNLESIELEISKFFAYQSRDISRSTMFL